MGKYDWRVREEVVVDKFGTKTLKTIVESYKLSGDPYVSIEPVSQRILPANVFIKDVGTDSDNRITRVIYYKDNRRTAIE